MTNENNDLRLNRSEKQIGQEAEKSTIGVNKVEERPFDDEQMEKYIQSRGYVGTLAQFNEEPLDIRVQYSWEEN